MPFSIRLRRQFSLQSTVLFLLIAVIGLGAAHLFRFTPMPGDNSLTLDPMWDRWFQRVCVISFLGDNQLTCSAQTLSGESTQSDKTTSRAMSQVEQLRQAGFSEREVLEWVEKELKTKRKQGMSDADLAVSLFGLSQKLQKDTP